MGNCLPLSLKFLNLVIVRCNFTKHREEMYLSDGIACAARFFTSSCCIFPRSRLSALIKLTNFRDKNLKKVSEKDSVRQKIR